MNVMKLSPLGARFIKGWEMLALTSYPDPASPLGQKCAMRGLQMTDYMKLPDWRIWDGRPWTIAYGRTKGVVQGQACDEATADAWFAEEIAEYENDVNLLLKVPVTQWQYDALTSFAYNVGPDMNHNGIAEGLGDSTLLRKVNASDFVGAALEFPKWNNGPHGPLPGLTARRAGEKLMFQYNRYDIHNGPLINGVTGQTIPLGA